MLPVLREELQILVGITADIKSSVLIRYKSPQIGRGRTEFERDAFGSNEQCYVAVANPDAADKKQGILGVVQFYNSVQLFSVDEVIHSDTKEDWKSKG